MSEFVDFLIEQMAPVAPVTARAMFGGHALYAHGVAFGLVADDVLYLKIDEATRGAFEAAGSAPFVYVSRGRSVTMSYYEMPAEAYDEPEAMARWTGLGIAAARRGRTAKPGRRGASRKGRPRD